MTTPNHPDSQDSDLNKVLEIINQLARKSAGGDYIYRGEPKRYAKVSSSLYRSLNDQFQEFKEVMDISEIPVEAIQAWILDEAEKFTPHSTETEQFEILAQLQHYGGETNLIDFTTDYLTALFFACDGEANECGRVILLSKSGDMGRHITAASNPANRVIAQKSIFVRPPKGFIEPSNTVTVPHNLKQPILDYLRICHGISTETIYNDLYGFIRVQDIHQQAYARLYAGIICDNNENYKQAIEHYTEALRLNSQISTAYNNRGAIYAEDGEYDIAIRDYNKAINLDPTDPITYYNRGVAYASKGDFDQAIQDYNMSLDLEPDDSDVYYNRSVARLCLSKWEDAKSDLAIVTDMQVDIKADFNEEYGSVAEFEERYGVKLPGDIKEMLN